jgi:hypothetical protein
LLQKCHHFSTQTSILSHESLRSAARARPRDGIVAARSRTMTRRTFESQRLICIDFDAAASEEVA